jgi:hypothetical protein
MKLHEKAFIKVKVLDVPNLLNKIKTELPNHHWADNNSDLLEHYYSRLTPYVANETHIYLAIEPNNTLRFARATRFLETISATISEFVDYTIYAYEELYPQSKKLCLYTNR